jgi:hypothetical protein
MNVLYVRELLWIDDAVHLLDVVAIAFHRQDPNHFTAYPDT